MCRTENPTGLPRPKGWNHMDQKDCKEHVTRLCTSILSIFIHIYPSLSTVFLGSFTHCTFWGLSSFFATFASSKLPIECFAPGIFVYNARAMGNHQTEEQLRAFLAEYPADLRRKVQEMRQA